MPLDADLLGSLPFFTRLPPEQRRAIAQVLVERHYGPGGMIFKEGAVARAVALLIDGTVHVEVDAGPDRPRARVNTLGRGEMLGEVSLLDGGRRSASCIAGERGAHVALLSRDDFTRLFEAGNPFAFSMVRLIVRRLSRRVQHAARLWGESVRAGEDPENTLDHPEATFGE